MLRTRVEISFAWLERRVRISTSAIAASVLTHSPENDGIDFCINGHLTTSCEAMNRSKAVRGLGRNHALSPFRRPGRTTLAGCRHRRANSVGSMTTEPTEDPTAVLYEANEGVATITLNRPETLNSMNDDLMNGLNRALQRVVDDDAIRVAVLTGSGRGFCSGADLSGAAESDADGEVDLGSATADGMDNVFHPPIRLLSELPVPTIAKVNGVAAGGGLGLALGCDIAIAARSARFVCTFGPRLGIVPDLGTTFHLPLRVGSARARGIAMLGESISAEQAEAWGMIWSAVDDDALDGAVDSVVGSLVGSSPNAMTRIRGALAAAETNTLSDQLDLERDNQRILIPLNMTEGATAFMEKREPKFDGVRDGS